MTNSCHSLTKKRPDPLRNETSENCLPRDSRSVASLLLFVGINSTVLRRTTRGGRGGDSLTARILLSKIGQM